MFKLQVTKCTDTNYINVVVYCNSVVVIDKLIKISNI